MPENSKPWQLSENALTVLESRYLRRDEDPDGLRRRVARGIASAEKDPASVDKWAERFEALLTNWDFLPNSPTLMNAGTKVKQLSACFVLPIEDSIDSIFDTLKLMALIQQSGGGTGFSFSRLRAKGMPVATTGGKASGPVSFLKIFDTSTEHIRQGGRRRGANMGILRADHPDIEEFIDAKLDGTTFRNFNLSVGVTDDVMRAMINDSPITLKNPGDGKITGTIPGGKLFKQIAKAAWTSGDPGLVFLDAINRDNPTPALGEIESTNPCGEVPLLPYEACNLGSINLSRMITDSKIDWKKLEDTTRVAIRFLDNVIEVNEFPDDRIRNIVRGNRKIGLGVMGFAELLIRLNTPYASDEAVKIAEDVMAFIHKHATSASQDLAKERGNFPNWKESRYGKTNTPMRNATVTSIAPTGTLSILADTSPGIEPLFALVFHRNVLDGKRLREVSSLFLEHAKKENLASDRFFAEVEKSGTLSGLNVSSKTRELFKTALELSPMDHLRIQLAFQKHVDNAVSKTVNLPNSATVETVTAIYRKAWEHGLKGITVFRSGSRDVQVMETASSYFVCEPECGV